MLTESKYFLIITSTFIFQYLHNNNSSNSNNKLNRHLSDVYHDGLDDTAPHLLARMLRRWNKIGNERKRIKDMTGFALLRMTAKEINRLEYDHLSCTRALLCLVDRDHRACLWTRSSPKALSALQNAIKLHQDDAIIKKHNTDLSAICLVPTVASEASKRLAQSSKVSYPNILKNQSSNKMKILSHNSPGLPRPNLSTLPKSLNNETTRNKLCHEGSPLIRKEHPDLPVSMFRFTRLDILKVQSHASSNYSGNGHTERYAFDRLNLNQDMCLAGVVGIQGKQRLIPLGKEGGPKTSGLFPS